MEYDGTRSDPAKNYSSATPSCLSTTQLVRVDETDALLDQAYNCVRPSFAKKATV